MGDRASRLALVIGLLVVARPEKAFASSPENYAKAGFLLISTRYVTWPDAVFSTPESPIVVGVLGPDPFGTWLDTAFAAITSQGRKVELRRASTAEEAKSFHVVFIAREESRRCSGWLDTLRRFPVLTVVETERAFESGAMIRLVMEGKRLRFDVNLEAGREPGIRIGSSMLVSARRIIRKW